MEDNDSVIFSDKWSTIADVSSLNLNYRRASGISPCTLTGIRVIRCCEFRVIRWFNVLETETKTEVMQKKKVQSTRGK